MKLIYLYVRDYKVLNNVEITLSSQFEVSRNGNVFKIRNSKIPEDFYSSKIDIISIFGKNGSGKSTTIEFIKKFLNAREFPIDEGYQDFDYEEEFESVVILEMFGKIWFIDTINSKNKIYVEYNGEVVSELYITDLYREHTSMLYFNHAIESTSTCQELPKRKLFEYIDCSNSHLISRASNKRYSHLDIKAQFDLLSKCSLSFLNTNGIPMLASFNLYKEVDKRHRKIIRLLTSMDLYVNNIQKSKWESEPYNLELLDCIQNSVEEFVETYEIRLKIEHHKFPILKAFYTVQELCAYLIKSDSLYEKLHLFPFEVFHFFLSLENATKEAIWKLKTFDAEGAMDTGIDSSLSIFIQYYKYMTESISHFISNKKIFRNIYDEELCELGDVITSSINTSNFNFNDRNLLVANIAIKTFDEYRKYTLLIEKYRDFLGSLNIKWNGISSGEYSTLSMYSRLYEFFPDKSGEVIVIIDEGELFLHPEWQRRYISNLIEFFDQVRKDKQSIKLIITSHSPMILSDLPKESVNFLGVDSDTSSFFGADLNDVYKEGFVVERLMGEFAYQKIKKTAEKIRDGDRTKETIEEIELIGNDFVKKIFKGLVDNK